MSLIFKKQPITRQLAKELRAASTKQPDLFGHVFKFNDLKQLWQAGDHAVLTHDRDQVWQYWYHVPVGGWRAISIHDTMQEAQDAAETSKHPEQPEPEPEEQEEKGTFVLFRTGEDRPWHRVLIQSSDGGKKLTDMYTSLGYENKIETVS